MARIVVTGAGGLLGSTLVPVLISQGQQVVALSRSGGVDLTVADSAWQALESAAPDVIVNLAAATSVDACESDPQLAYRLNTQAVENVVRWISDLNKACHLIQISTDQVYDGAGPHREDRICPVNYYAFSKYAGELVAGRVRATILRTNLFGRSLCPGRGSISDWLVDSMRRQTPITVFDDVLFTPLSLQTLSKMIAIAVEKKIPGTFNLGSRDGMSKAEFAFRLAECLGLRTDQLMRGPSSAVTLAARRPKDMRMHSTRFESSFGVALPTLGSEIGLMRGAYADYA